MLSKDKNTPLHLASEKGHTLIIKLLLEKGANIKALNKVSTIILLLS